MALGEEAGEAGEPPPQHEAHVEWQMAEDDLWRDEVVREVEVGRPSPAVPAALFTPPYCCSHPAGTHRSRYSPGGPPGRYAVPWRVSEGSSSAPHARRPL